MKKKIVSFVFLVVGVAGLHAQSFNIDFSSIHGTPSSTYGAATSQTGTWNTVGLAPPPWSV